MPRFAVEMCFTQPEQGRLCAAGAAVEGAPAAGMQAEIEGHLQRSRAEVIAVETMTLRSGRSVELLVFELAASPWRPLLADGRVLLLEG